MRWPWGLTLALASACSCGGGSGVVSTFEASDEGWTLGGDPTSPTPELRATGGNPGGNICGTDAVQSDIWYFIAPSPFLGDKSAFYGKRLTWDLEQFTSFQQLHGR